MRRARCSSRAATSKGRPASATFPSAKSRRVGLSVLHLCVLRQELTGGLAEGAGTTTAAPTCKSACLQPAAQHRHHPVRKWLSSEPSLHGYALVDQGVQGRAVCSARLPQQICSLLVHGQLFSSPHVLRRLLPNLPAAPTPGTATWSTTTTVRTVRVQGHLSPAAVSPCADGCSDGRDSQLRDGCQIYAPPKLHAVSLRQASGLIRRRDDNVHRRWLVGQASCRAAVRARTFNGI